MSLITSSMTVLAENQKPENDLSTETAEDYGYKPGGYDCLSRQEKEKIQNCFDERALEKAQVTELSADAEPTGYSYIGVGLLGVVLGAVAGKYLAK